MFPKCVTKQFTAHTTSNKLVQ